MDTDDVEYNSLNDNRSIIPRAEHDAKIEILKGDFNVYASKKSVSQVELDTSIIAQYIGYLITLFLIHQSIPDPSVPLNGFEITFMTLIIVSLSVQLVMFILIIILYNAKGDAGRRGCSIDTMNSWAGTLSHIVLIISIPITALATHVILNKALALVQRIRELELLLSSVN